MRLFQTFSERCTLYPAGTVSTDSPFDEVTDVTAITNVPCAFVSQSDLVRKLGATYATYSGMIIIGPDQAVVESMQVERDLEPGRIYQIKKLERPHRLKRDQFICWQLLLG